MIVFVGSLRVGEGKASLCGEEVLWDIFSSHHCCIFRHYILERRQM